MSAAASKDPLPQPSRLKHLTLRDRVMSTAHEPVCREDGTLPLDDVHFELKPLSATLGAVDYEAMKDI